MSAMIAIENLTKRYGTTQALKGISFEVPKGQVVGFLGPNGAGKSTTMKILTGYVEATGGSVKVAGISVADDALNARRHIGYLPENNPLYEDMMVEEFLSYVGDVRELGAGKRKAIDVAVDRCGLGKVRGKDIGELSKGFRQRVGLAQAILHNPDLLILDEPTTGLDPNQVVEIRDLIRELGQEKTVILSTHVLPEVQHMCSRALIISDGTLVADGHPNALSRFGEKDGASDIVDVVVAPRQVSGLGAADVSALFAKIRGVDDVRAKPTPEKDALAFTLASTADVRRDLFEACVDNGLVLLGLERRQISLEETFRKLTTESKGASTTTTKEGAHA